MAEPIVNIDALEYRTISHGDQFQARMGEIAVRTGASRLGYNLTIVPPGKRAFPLHNHHVIEEMFFVLSGSGEVRIGEKRLPLREGDVLASPAGGPETAHQIINTSDTDELRYLAVSTMDSPDLVEYPDSGKFLVHAVTGTNDDGSPKVFRHIGRTTDALDYWDGE